MPDTLPNLGLPLLVPSQAQKTVTHNEALLILDSLVQLAVLDRDRTEPPGLPAPGDRHIVAAPAAAEWSGHDHSIATMTESGWRYDLPAPGWIGYDRGAGALVLFDGTGWGPLPLPELIANLGGIGVNTSPDGSDRLAVAADASRFSHDGSDHRLRINKAAAADTASVVLQSGWSGRAEIGLAGDDDLSLKVSPDGTAWTEALRLDAASGHATGAAIQQSATDTTAGRLMRADWGYGPGNLLGPVGESAGIPTGAVIEHGSNADGDYVRYADGTQICTRTLTGIAVGSAYGSLFRSAVLTASYAAPFVTRPTASGCCQSTSMCWANVRSSSPTQWGCALWSTEARSSETAELIAIGRWY